jgi:ATP-dependent DNA helicase RecG
MEKRYRSKDPLLESSQYVKGVGPQRQVLLQRLGIATVEDLLLHVPRKYYDRGDLVPVSRVTPGMQSTFVATVLAASLRRIRGGRSMMTAAVGDETGTVNLVFFNQPYLERYFKSGVRVLVSGEPVIYKGSKQLVSPEFEIISGELNRSLLDTGRITPVYPLTSGISQRMMRSIIGSALEKSMGSIRENLPSGLVRREDFVSRKEALHQIHHPSSWEDLERARARLKFEEVFFLHLLLKERRGGFTRNRVRPEVGPPYHLLERFLSGLPFTLTGAQMRVLGEIRADLESPRGLNRLLQGDVGSGKTIVGIAAMLMTVEKGFQAALMVPTEILAQQHYHRVLGYLEGHDLSVELLIGSMPRSEKSRVQQGLSDGSVDLVIGTHALIQEGISFRQLGIAVIDEQHRFGVRQRATLGAGDLLPHFLVMTATPIPRSLAQIVYGDLELSLIDELPAGERNVATEIVTRDEIERVYEAVRGAFSRGKQVFILYPLVEESELSDLKAATQEFERLQSEELSGYPIGLLHGRMSFEEKSKAVQLFRDGGILGLVTTTVIEVGVDVPNASILVIHHPERFGLAQLHQLRGRVGRGGDGGRCFLVAGAETGTAAQSRHAYFARVNDGFEVAEEDLRVRGPGEIWGIRQSGYPSFRLINPLSDNEVVQRSWRECDRLLDADPELARAENRVVADYFRRYYKQKLEVAEIG